MESIAINKRFLKLYDDLPISLSLCVIGEYPCLKPIHVSSPGIYLDFSVNVLYVSTNLRFIIRKVVTLRGILLLVRKLSIKANDLDVIRFIKLVFRCSAKPYTISNFFSLMNVNSFGISEGGSCMSTFNIPTNCPEAFL